MEFLLQLELEKTGSPKKVRRTYIRFTAITDGSEIQLDMLDLPSVLAHPGRRLYYTCQVVWA